MYFSFAAGVPGRVRACVSILGGSAHWPTPPAGRQAGVFSEKRRSRISLLPEKKVNVQRREPRRKRRPPGGIAEINALCARPECSPPVGSREERFVYVAGNAPRRSREG